MGSKQPFFTPVAPLRAENVKLQHYRKLRLGKSLLHIYQGGCPYMRALGCLLNKMP
jgi:hypothetical protein